MNADGRDVKDIFPRCPVIRSRTAVRAFSVTLLCGHKNHIDEFPFSAFHAPTSNKILANIWYPYWPYISDTRAENLYYDCWNVLCVRPEFEWGYLRQCSLCIYRFPEALRSSVELWFRTRGNSSRPWKASRILKVRQTPSTLRQSVPLELLRFKAGPLSCPRWSLQARPQQGNITDDATE